VLTIGEYIGVRLKQRVQNQLRTRHVNSFDNWLGSLLAAISLVLSAWLMASVLGSLPVNGLQKPIQQSHIIRELNRLLPDAPTVIADLGRLVDPNGFPQVFVGNEPVPRSDIDLPSLGSLQNAVKADQASVVKVEGQGCGGIVEGSGFVIGPNLVATNAHVVAGIKKPFVADANGNRAATPVWFDPDLDFAVLRVNNLAGKPLTLSDATIPASAAAAAMGYPGGGALKASAAAILNEFNARGKNIYNQSRITRTVYELKASIIPGNSGGPLVAADGSVIGVIFAESTSYKNVGYALTIPQVLQEIHKVNVRSSTVSTGTCAE